MKKAVPAGRQGFTLIELLVALSLSAIFLIAGTYLVSTYLRAYQLSSHKIEGVQIRQMVLTRLLLDLKGAEAILPSTNARLSLKVAGSTVSYDLKDKKVRRQKDASTAYLTEAGEVSALKFSYPRPRLVIITLDKVVTGGFCRNGE